MRAGFCWRQVVTWIYDPWIVQVQVIRTGILDHDHACQHTRGDAGTVCVCTCGKPDDASRTGSAGIFQNIVEMIVEMLDGMVESSMGSYAKKYRNYIGSIFIFILSAISQVCLGFGLRQRTMA